jgi:hypothetical protein
VIRVIDKINVEPAIRELPIALRVTAEPVSRRRNRRRAYDCRGSRTFDIVHVSMHAMQGKVAASQHPRLLAAA